MPGGKPIRRTFSKTVTVVSNTDARAAVEHDRDAIALIHRGGKYRSVVFACPSNCGDLIVLNLDSRAGPAWRVKLSEGRVSLLPSVWRDSGCGSHFIVWESEVWWCGIGESEYDDLPLPLRRGLKDEWTSIRARKRK
jgi:hypothetical protein